MHNVQHLHSAHCKVLESTGQITPPIWGVLDARHVARQATLWLTVHLHSTELPHYEQSCTHVICSSLFVDHSRIVGFQMILSLDIWRRCTGFCTGKGPIRQGLLNKNVQKCDYTAKSVQFWLQAWTKPSVSCLVQAWRSGLDCRTAGHRPTMCQTKTRSGPSWP